MLAIRTPRMFDGQRFTDGGVTVLIDDGRIQAVEQGFAEVPDGWQVLEHQDATVLPGLIDTHVHLVTDSGQGALDRVAGYTDDEIDAVITEGLSRHLEAGVTTVRDLGDRGFAVLDRRDRQRSGPTPRPEPTILASGPPLTSPGGHCFYMGGEVDGQDAVAAAIRERIDRRADIVKVMSSGGMATIGTDVMRPQFSLADLKFLVDEAHAAGLPVTAHAHALPAVEFAIQVGVDGIEHCSCLTPKGPLMSDELLESLASSGIAIGGALMSPPVDDFDQAPPTMKALMEKLGMTPEVMIATRLAAIERMYRGGVRFVTGSDAGIGPFTGHGLLRNSIGFFVRAGASTEDALAASTSLAAEVCQVGVRKGLLRKGYDADIIVVGGDLRADVSALQDVRSVVLGGTPIH